MGKAVTDVIRVKSNDIKDAFSIMCHLFYQQSVLKVSDYDKKTRSVALLKAASTQQTIPPTPSIRTGVN